MSLSSVAATGWPLWLALTALAAYALSALPGQSLQPVAVPALGVGVVAHALMLAAEVGSVGVDGTAARLGFGPVLSLTVCLVLAVHAIESRWLPVPAVRRVLGLAGLAAVTLALFFPGEVRTLGSKWAPLHWLLGVAAYGLFGAAVLHGLLLDEADRRMRQHGAGGVAPHHFGIPLLQLERLTFRFVQAGFAVLSVAIVMGIVTSARWRFDHKTVLSLLSWGLFAALLIGRQRHGWRGRQATRWLYAGALVLLLAYAGTRFVTEVLLSRGA
jgi:ABC-type uncharacterized transport system permease subunit